MPRQKVYFGPYILLQTLGEGEFGKVKLDARVTANTHLEDLDLPPDFFAPLDRIDIPALDQLVRHPNIVRLYDVIETEKYIGIVLEYASGTSA
jgi:serine/threonine protein kinase